MNLTRQVNLALAQIVPNQSITKNRLRRLNQLVKAQLESFEASAFPEEKELLHNVSHILATNGTLDLASDWLKLMTNHVDPTSKIPLVSHASLKYHIIRVRLVLA